MQRKLQICWWVGVKSLTLGQIFILPIRRVPITTLLLVGFPTRPAEIGSFFNIINLFPLVPANISTKDCAICSDTQSEGIANTVGPDFGNIVIGVAVIIRVIIRRASIRVDTQHFSRQRIHIVGP